MGDRLAAIEMGLKVGELLCPLLGGRELRPHPTQYRLGKLYLRTKWHLDASSRLATTDMGEKRVL